LAEKSTGLKLGWGLKFYMVLELSYEKQRYFSKSESWDNSHFTGQNFEFVIFSRKGSMATGLRVEDRLDGATNFGAWKEMMILLLQENKL
jgi:hypothetical protein